MCSSQKDTTLKCTLKIKFNNLLTDLLTQWVSYAIFEIISVYLWYTAILMLNLVSLANIIVEICVFKQTTFSKFFYYANKIGER